MISCLVTKDARALGKDGVHSHTKIAAIHGISQDRCLAYEFPLDQRRLHQDFSSTSAPFEAKQSHDQAARSYFKSKVGTPGKLMEYVAKNIENNAWEMLESLLTSKAREIYGFRLTVIDEKLEKSIERAERSYNRATYDGANANKRAIKAFDKLLDKTESESKARRARSWINLFKKPSNRIAVWRK
ncbi:MAG: hypothetical protein G01um101419_404 [Parcubacteria group bacterium Gr01-1014_19]|nr:MAG: hypothetical protein G01um101419_404 [Parcubacteria group bacterium Gr01-1014_19]